MSDQDATHATETVRAKKTLSGTNLTTGFWSDILRIVGPKRLCWGWEPDDVPNYGDEQATLTEGEETARAMMGCDEESCQTRESPAWVRSLSDEQIVDRADVMTWWDDGIEAVASRFDHLAADDTTPEVTAVA